MKKTARKILSLILSLVLIFSLAAVVFAETWSITEDYDGDRYEVYASLTLNTLSVNATLSVLDYEADEYITDDSSQVVLTYKYYPEDGSALETVVKYGNCRYGVNRAVASYTSDQVYRIRSASATYRATIPASYEPQTFTATSRTLEQ